MTGDQKTGVWIVALIAAVVISIVFSVTFYYHQKSARQADAPRAAVNLDLSCRVNPVEVETP